MCMHRHACMSDVYIYNIYTHWGKSMKKIFRYEVIIISKDKSLLRINSLIYSVDTDKP